jgi:hypothetical protein
MADSRPIHCRDVHLLHDAENGKRESAMKLACNIDAKGKAVRLRMGLIQLALAAVVAVATGLAVRSPVGSAIGWSGWAISGILTLVGAFSIFEARAGWCALRALGFRTRV